MHWPDGGGSAQCCAEELAGRVDLMVAAHRARTGRGPRTPAALTFDADFEVDPVGAVWRLADAEDGPVRG